MKRAGEPTIRQPEATKAEVMAERRRIARPRKPPRLQKGLKARAPQVKEGASARTSSAPRAVALVNIAKGMPTQTSDAPCATRPPCGREPARLADI